MSKEIVWGPQTIQRTWFSRVQSKPRLPFTTPMEETHRTGMKSTAQTFEIVAAQTMLVPPVLDTFNVSGEDQQERRQGTQLVDPIPLLDPHPVLQLLREPPFPPFPQIDHHHTRVEIARAATPKRRREDWVGEVDPRVVERLVQCSANGVRDLALDDVDVEMVEVEAEVWERGGDNSPEVAPALGRDEVEDDVLRARGVLQDGEDAGDRTPEVLPGTRESDGRRRGHREAYSEGDDDDDTETVELSHGV
ncbi:hypothetical protein FNV43_RR26721 [Rhamnella rubrinervis]|uniref:Uncharacterized protein n=1 Tax=Rhamnella rubrinervis TaxID=2594499 RepID=A0A8K0DPN3_9ROSA|nr:hypothetical protein FNV43_RR26721 [Rhamnella rubrinervis]